MLAPKYGGPFLPMLFFCVFRPLRCSLGVYAGIVVPYNVGTVRPTPVPLIGRINTVPYSSMVVSYFFNMPGIFKRSLVMWRKRAAIVKDLPRKDRAGYFFSSHHARGKMRTVKQNFNLSKHHTSPSS